MKLILVAEPQRAQRSRRGYVILGSPSLQFLYFFSAKPLRSLRLCARINNPTLRENRKPPQRENKKASGLENLEVLKIVTVFHFWAYPMYFRNTNGRGMGEEWEQTLSNALAIDG